MLKPTQDKEATLTTDEIITLVNGDYIPYWIWDILTAQLVKLEKLGYYKGLPTHIEEALNSGDGVYRP